MKMRREQGITLLEIAVAMGVLGALAAMAIPALGRMQQKGYDAKCLSNLRQIGVGILSYSCDHNGYLPGPLTSHQLPFYKHNSQLSHHLAAYLQMNTSIMKQDRDDVFVCPAYKNALRREGKALIDTPVYTINILVPMGDPPQLVTPFGYPNAGNPRVFKTWDDYPPMPLARLADITDENGRPAQTRTWLLKDIDYTEALRDFINGDNRGALLSRKAHGNHRNALFYDFHVAPIDFDTTKKQ